MENDLILVGKYRGKVHLGYRDDSITVCGWQTGWPNTRLERSGEVTCSKCIEWKERGEGKRPDPRRDNRRFQSTFGGGSGVYTCVECGKRTRETGEGESALEMCRRCYTLSGWQNAVADGNLTKEGYEEAVRKYDKGGK